MSDEEVASQEEPEEVVEEECLVEDEKMFKFLLSIMDDRDLSAENSDEHTSDSTGQTSPTGEVSTSLAKQVDPAAYPGNTLQYTEAWCPNVDNAWGYPGAHVYTALPRPQSLMPSNNNDVQEPFVTKSKSHKKEFYCALCDVLARSEDGLRAHRNGIKHTKKCRLFHVQTNGLPIRSVSKGHAAVTHFRCEICGINTTDEAGLQAHFAGQKHMKKLKLLKIQDPHGTAPISKFMPSGIPSKKSVEKEIQHTNMPFRCELCGIFTTDKSGLEAHYAGQKHKKRVMKMQNIANFWGGDDGNSSADGERRNNNQHAVSILNEYAQHTTQPIMWNASTVCSAGSLFGDKNGGKRGGSPTFVVSVEIRGRSGEVIHAKGFSSSKKEAKLNAAKQALEQLYCKPEDDQQELRDHNTQHST